MNDILERQFSDLINGVFDDFTAQVRFHPSRRWKFDFADVERKIAVEIEGGLFTRGRHVSPIGFSKDCEKYNAAAVLGWCVLRFTTLDFNTQSAKQMMLDTIKLAVDARK